MVYPNALHLTDQTKKMWYLTSQIQKAKMACVLCGWDAFGCYDTLLYGKAGVCSCCLANGRVLYRRGPVSKPAEKPTLS